MQLILGNDAAWGGWGYCLGTEQGPIATRHVAIAGKAWRWPHVVRELNGPIAGLLCDAEMMRRPEDPPVRLVIEEAPAVYSGANRQPGKRAGNQAATCYGLGRLAGAIELWSALRPELAYPWPVTPMEWRAWWKLGGKGRLEKKRAAVTLCRSLGWGRFLDPFPWDPDPEAAGGAQGDVADAILITVGAARNAALAPKGPQRGLFAA